MRSPIFRTALAGLALVSLASVAHAQLGGMATSGVRRLVSFGIGGGVSVPVADAKDAFKTGFNGQGFVRLNLNQLPIMPRLDFTFSRFDIDDVKIGMPGASGNGQIFAGIANLQYSIMPAGPIRPYIVAGIGAYNSKVTIDGVPSSSLPDSRTDFGINGGAGVTFKIGNMVSGYAEGRVDNVFSKKGFTSADQIQVVPVTFGLVF